MILAGDIGGTSTRLAYFEVQEGKLTQLVMEKFSSRAHNGLAEIVREFMQKHSVKVEYAAFGIAGPVRHQRVEATNLPWVVDAANLKSELVTTEVSLLNDLEANTYGIFELGPSDFAVINAGNPEEPGNIAVISAGTGLGEAGATWDGMRFVVYASEGGHADFAPRDELEIDLLLYIRQRLGGRVSYERILSGPGIYNIYQFLRDTKRGEEEAWLRDELKQGDPSAIVSQHGLDGTSDLCSRTLDLFVELYGAEAGNLALKMMATRGVFVGGGIAPKILPKMLTGSFLQAFAEKGRFEKLLRSIPVRILLNDQAALYGAARFAGLQAGLIQRAHVI
ncbi:MAG: glucokinase [Chloroflexota bacterium]|nr:MAG: glucokinase [Chloroflexota bacterium]